MQPGEWSAAMETALSRACAIPSIALAADVLRLLAATPDHGLAPEWHSVADAARAWLSRLERVEVPPFHRPGVIDAAVALRCPTATAYLPASRAMARSGAVPSRPAWQNRADSGDGEPLQ